MTKEAAKNTYLIGFWYRFGARIFDSLIFSIAYTSIMLPIFGLEAFQHQKLLLIFIIPNLVWGIYLIGFWVWKSQTPGNWLVSQQVRDFKTGKKLTKKQSIIRWLSMFLSGLPLGLGFIWVAWDKNKRAWHDYLAGTVVVSDNSYVPSPSDRLYKPSQNSNK